MNYISIVAFSVYNYYSRLHERRYWAITDIVYDANSHLSKKENLAVAFLSLVTFDLPEIFSFFLCVPVNAVLWTQLSFLFFLFHHHSNRHRRSFGVRVSCAFT